MSLLDELGYRPASANAVQRGMQMVASSRPGSWLFQRTLYSVDKLLFRISGGRVTVPAVVAGLPIVMFTTTGAKSGQERTMPLLAVPIDDKLAIIGSNYGQQATPGWVYNLEANPAATIAHGDRSVAVTARSTNDDENDRVWAQAIAIYPGYAKYRERASHRVIRTFILEPASGPARDDSG